MDQNVVSGVGNIYANETCFNAKLNPRERVNMKYLLQKISLINLFLKQSETLRGIYLLMRYGDNPEKYLEDLNQKE